MTGQDELTALRKEVAELREELRQAREMAGQQIHHHYAPMAVMPPCTCGSTTRCQVHPAPWQTGVGWQNLCGGAAGMPQSYLVDTTGAGTLTVTGLCGPAFGAAGCAPQPQVLTLGRQETR